MEHDAGRLPVSGHLADSGGAFQIGRNLEQLPAAASINIPASYSFDGIIDELKIYTRALDATEIKASYESFARGRSASTHLAYAAPHSRRREALWRLLYPPEVYPECDQLWRIE